MESTVEPKQEDWSLLRDDPKDILVNVPTGALRINNQVTKNKRAVVHSLFKLVLFTSNNTNW